MVYEGVSRPHVPRPSKYTLSTEEKEATRDRLAERRIGLHNALKVAKENNKDVVAKIATDWGASKQSVGLILGAAGPKGSRAATAHSGWVSSEMANLNDSAYKSTRSLLTRWMSVNRASFRPRTRRREMDRRNLHEGIWFRLRNYRRRAQGGVPPPGRGKP